MKNIISRSLSCCLHVWYLVETFGETMDCVLPLKVQL